MQKTLVALYGSTRIGKRDVDFVRDLAEAFLAYPDVVLVTGGFWHWESDPDIAETSVDLATLKAVEDYATREGIAVTDRLQTWLPEQPRENVKRFSKGDVRELKGSPRARRFQLVQGVDAILTIGGEEHTATVLELALAIGKPIMPVGFTGGDSGDFWNEDREQFVDWLEIPPELAISLGAGWSSERDRKTLAEQIAKIMIKKTQRRCLVLMEFGAEHDDFYETTLSPAIKIAGFKPHRLDRDEDAGSIPELLLSRLADCAAVIVDITGLNPNVMYELGHIRYGGVVSPLIVTRDNKETLEIPFYLRQDKIIFADDDAQTVKQSIERQLMLTRRERQTPVWK
jgi:hypothetical protein